MWEDYLVVDVFSFVFDVPAIFVSFCKVVRAGLGSSDLEVLWVSDAEHRGSIQ